MTCSSLSCDAHSGIEPGAPQAVGLARLHVSPSSSSSSAMIAFRVMLAAPVSGSQVASQGSALSATAGSLLHGAALLRLSSGAAPVAGLARPPNAAAGTSMPIRQSRGSSDGDKAPDMAPATQITRLPDLQTCKFRSTSKRRNGG
eukprot:scaffold72970_cov62-Phaeocystis_antarctica.AAC.2